MSRFDDLISSPVILTEGSVLERLRRDGATHLDSDVEHAGLIYEPSGRSSLEHIYRQYLDIGKTNDLPMIVFSPTWRANPERIAHAGLIEQRVNEDCVRFLDDLRKSYGPYARKVLLGGLMGCRGDAYRPEEALSRAEARAFHREQIRALSDAPVDFLFAATLPAASEAEGIALAMSEGQLPFALSFVIGGDGCLLDGTPLHEAVAAIEAAAPRPPAFFMVNCVHPLVFRKSFTIEMMASQRDVSHVIGLQANTSPRSPRELDDLPFLETEDPERLADAMIRLAQDFGLRILGGCCGTDEHHIEAIAERAAAMLQGVWRS